MNEQGKLLAIGKGIAFYFVDFAITAILSIILIFTLSQVGLANWPLSVGYSIFGLAGVLASIVTVSLLHNHYSKSEYALAALSVTALLMSYPGVVDLSESIGLQMVVFAMILTQSSYALGWYLSQKGKLRIPHSKFITYFLVIIGVGLVVYEFITTFV